MGLPCEQIITLVIENKNNQFSNYQDKKLLTNVLNLWDSILPSDSKFLVNELGNIEWFQRVETQRGGKVYCNLSITRLIEHGKQMLALRNCANFNSFVKSFCHDQQFLATLFELECAYFCYTNFHDVMLEFCPQVIINGKNKCPDFKIIHYKVGEIFCECKDLTSTNRVKQSRTIKLAEHIEADLQLLVPDMPEDLRVEIFFEKLPRHFNRNLGGQLVAAIKTVLQVKKVGLPVALNFKDGATVRFICQKMNSPIYFNNASEFLARGDKNKKLTNRENAPIIISTKENCGHVDCYKQIKDAITQLPPENNFMVFLNPSCHLSKFNLDKLSLCINIPKYKKMLVAFLMYPDKPCPMHPCINGKLIGQSELENLLGNCS